MDLKTFVKSEISGFKPVEKYGLIFVFSFIFVSAYLYKDSKIAVMSAVCGILYSTLAGKGKVSCYVFGLMGTVCYSYLSLKNALYGNLILYMGYYFPMQIIGIFAWSRHLKKDTNEIYKTCLSKKEIIQLCITAVISCMAVVAVLAYFKDSSPVFDGITTVLSVFGMYLTVKRCIEQWVVWMIVNGLSCVMWLNLVLNGAKTFSTFIMWSVYFVLSIYFFFIWRKELNEQ